MAKDNTKDQKTTSRTQLPAGDTFENALLKTAPKMLEGGEYHKRDEYVINQLASYYGVDKQKVTDELKKAVDALPKVDIKPEDAAKKEAAAKAEREAVQARQFALEAERDAKEATQRAAAAKAEAEGRVLVSVPSSFWLHDKGMRTLIQKGTETLPREHAEHWYSVQNGVKILGLPTETEEVQK